MDKLWEGLFIIVGTVLFMLLVVGFGAMMEKFFQKRKASS